MGFDINVDLCYNMCSETGKPYYYHYDTETKKMLRVYELPQVEVPKELRQYLVGRGHLFFAYTQYFNDNDMGYCISADVFLDHYPSWEEVMEHEEFRDDVPDFWNEDDHNGFKKLLEWCVKQDYCFQVSWSY
jgi:hypothetical protein